MSPHTPAARFWRGLTIFLVCVLTMAAFSALLIWRSHRQDLTAKRLCQVISQIVSDQDKRLNSLAYYQHHPAELARAHHDNRMVLERLNCSTIPPVKGRP